MQDSAMLYARRLTTLLTKLQHLMPIIQEWEESESIPDSIFHQAAKDGLLMSIAADPAIPLNWEAKYSILVRYFR